VDACTQSVVSKYFGPDCQWITFCFCHIERSSQNGTEKVVSVGQISVVQPSRHSSFLVVSKLIAQNTQLNNFKRDAIQALQTDSNSVKGPTADELVNAFRLCLAISQEEAFPHESDAFAKGASIPKNSILKRVGPNIDPIDGLLKLDGRLQHAELPVRTRHPIIIAAYHHVSKLIIEDFPFRATIPAWNIR
jgi:hypothetical protein